MVDARRLTPDEIAAITGISSEHYVAQRNQLRRWGIKAEINPRREVVCFWAWIELAALPAGDQARYLQEPSANDEADDDIGMNLDAIRGPRSQA